MTKYENTKGQKDKKIMETGRQNTKRKNRRIQKDKENWSHM